MSWSLCEDKMTFVIGHLISLLMLIVMQTDMRRAGASPLGVVFVCFETSDVELIRGFAVEMPI